VVVVRVLFCRSVPDQLDQYVIVTWRYTCKLGREQVAWSFFGWAWSGNLGDRDDWVDL